MLRFKMLFAAVVVALCGWTVSYTRPPLTTQEALNQLGETSTPAVAPSFLSSLHFAAVPIAIAMVSIVFAPELRRWLRGTLSRNA